MSNLEADSNSGYFVDDRYSLNDFITVYGDLEKIFIDKLIGKLTTIRKKHGNFVFIKPDLIRVFVTEVSRRHCERPKGAK